MSLDKYEGLIKSIPLETRVLVDLEMSLIAFLADNDYIENRMWTDSEEDNKLLRIISNWSEEQAKGIIATIREWEEDGSPLT